MEAVTQLRVQDLLTLLQQENLHFYWLGDGGFYQLAIARKLPL